MNVTIIIPIHEYSDEIQTYLDKAIKSVDIQEKELELIIVCPSEVRDKIINKPQITSLSAITQSFVINDGATDYQSQINLAVKSVTTDYFSVLEFDDEYSATYFRNVEKYITSYPEIDVFLTMLIEVNEKNEGIKLTNETVWAQQFVGENGEIGYLNAKALKQYTDFKISGGIIKKSEFENLGGYKPNIKLTFMYEFLLRALNNASKIYSIPKIGYKHLATRENSLFDGYLKNMSVNERKFWFETATKESNFMNDRPIEYSKTLKVLDK